MSTPNLPLIAALRDVVGDGTPAHPQTAVVVAISPKSITIRPTGIGTTIPNVPVSGGTAGVALGDLVYLIWYGNTPIALASSQQAARSSSGAPVSAASAGVTQSQLQAAVDTLKALIDAKAGPDHNHSMDWIIATSGSVGGWDIGADKISNEHVVLQSGQDNTGAGGEVDSFLGIGPTAPTDFGANEGAWLGFDLGAGNDAEGQPTAGSAAKLSLFKDLNNYLQWTGEKLLISGENFTLDGDGKLHAHDAEIDGDITATSIEATTGTIGGNEIDTDGVQSPDYEPGISGWRLDKDGSAEFDRVKVRGSFKASVFEKGNVSALSGGLIVAKSAGALAADYTSGHVGGASVPMTATNPTGEFGWLFEPDDILRIKSASGDTWFKIVSQDSHDDKTQTYATDCMHGDEATVFSAGTGIVDYGQAGQGFFAVSADGTFLGVDGAAASWVLCTHDGQPWDPAHVTVQCYAGTDGKIYAGAGNVCLSSDGVKIVAKSGASSPDPQNKISWFTDGSFEGEMAYLGVVTSVANTDQIQSSITSSVNASNLIVARTPSYNKTATVTLLAANDANSTQGELDVCSDGSVYVNGYPLTGIPSDYMSNLVVVPVATNKVRVAYNSHSPATLMIAGTLCTATADIDLGTAPSGAAALWYIFANVSGSTFTLTCSTSSTESGNRRLAEIYWNGAALVYESLFVYAPGKPNLYYARASQVAGQSYNDSALAALSFDTENADNDNLWVVGSASRMTIQHPGVYIMNGYVTFPANTTGPRDTYLRVNNANVGGSSNRQDGGQATSASVTAIRYLKAGDYIQVFVRHGAGTALTVTGSLTVSALSA